jgi:hypothetical protein
MTKKNKQSNQRRIVIEQTEDKRRNKKKQQQKSLTKTMEYVQRTNLLMSKVTKERRVRTKNMKMKTNVNDIRS